MLKSLIFQLERLFRWEGAKGIKPATLSIASIDKSDEVCYNEAQPPTFIYSKESLDELDKLFPIIVYDPYKNTTHNQMIYNAGQRDVLRMIKQRMVQQRQRVL